MKTKKTKIVKIRDWNAVNAHFRRAGPIKDKSKEDDKKACRKWKPEED